MRTNGCHGGSAVTIGRFEVPPPPPPSWSATRLDSLVGLSGEARERVHENNVRLREADAERYAAHMKEYLRRARDWRTPDDILAAGRPTPPSDLHGSDPGATIAEQREMESLFGGALRAYRDGCAEISDRIARVEGRRVPLETYFEAALTAKVEVGGRSFGGTLSSRGGATPEVGVRAGPVGGATSGPGRAEVGVDAGLVGATVTVVDGRVDGAEVKVRAVPLVAVHAKRTGGALEHAISVGGKLGSSSGVAVHAEARVGVGVTLVTADFIRRALSKGDYWSRGE